MTIQTFKKIIKEKIEIKAFLYLTGEQGKKGKEISYKRVFSMKNRMVDISENVPVEKKKQ